MHRRTAQPFSLDFRASFAKAARVGEEIKKAVKGKNSKRKKTVPQRARCTRFPMGIKAANNSFLKKRKNP